MLWRMAKTSCDHFTSPTSRKLNNAINVNMSGFRQSGGKDYWQSFSTISKNETGLQRAEICARISLPADDTVLPPASTTAHSTSNAFTEKRINLFRDRAPKSRAQEGTSDDVIGISNYSVSTSTAPSNSVTLRKENAAADEVQQSLAGRSQQDASHTEVMNTSSHQDVTSIDSTAHPVQPARRGRPPSKKQTNTQPTASQATQSASPCEIHHPRITSAPGDTSTPFIDLSQPTPVKTCAPPVFGPFNDEDDAPGWPQTVNQLRINPDPVRKPRRMKGDLLSTAELPHLSDSIEMSFADLSVRDRGAVAAGQHQPTAVVAKRCSVPKSRPLPAASGAAAPVAVFTSQSGPKSTASPAVSAAAAEQVSINNVGNDDFRVFSLDLETSGFVKRSTRILEIAIVDVQTGRSFSTLVNPQMKNLGWSGAAAAAVHGITAKDCKGKPAFEEVMQNLIQFVEECCDGQDGASKILQTSDEMRISSKMVIRGNHGSQFGTTTTGGSSRRGSQVVVVAHNGVRFDFKMLQYECERVGVQIPSSWMYLDTLPLARALVARDVSNDKEGDEKPGFGQQDLRERFGLPQSQSTHRALADAEGLLGVYRELMRRAYASAASAAAVAAAGHLPATSMAVSDAPLGNHLKLSWDLLLHLTSIAPTCTGLLSCIGTPFMVRPGNVIESPKQALSDPNQLWTNIAEAVPSHVPPADDYASSSTTSRSGGGRTGRKSSPRPTSQHDLLTLVMAQHPGYDLLSLEHAIQILQGPHVHTRKSMNWLEQREIVYDAAAAATVCRHEGSISSTPQEAATSMIKPTDRATLVGSRSVTHDQMLRPNYYAAPPVTATATWRPFCFLLKNMKAPYGMSEWYAYSDRGNKPKWSLRLECLEKRDNTLQNVAVALDAAARKVLTTAKAGYNLNLTEPPSMLPGGKQLLATSSAYSLTVSLRAEVFITPPNHRRLHHPLTLSTVLGIHQDNHQVPSHNDRTLSCKQHANANHDASYPRTVGVVRHDYDSAVCSIGSHSLQSQLLPSSRCQECRAACTDNKTVGRSCQIKVDKDEGSQGSTVEAPHDHDMISWNLLTPITSTKSGRQHVVPLVSAPAPSTTVAAAAATVDHSIQMLQCSVENRNGDHPAHCVNFVKSHHHSAALLSSDNAMAMKENMMQADLESAKMQNVKAINAVFRPPSRPHHQPVKFDVLVWPESVWNMKEKGTYGIKLTALHVFLH
ncbi:hypothetical protein CEUSTIGMA_g6103.t1 [Chlamydomonas eustigma]|uniref:Exonuclease domain-containing protein n=1 Tax=Chlamydomonas eustigma TaxID=1157962 RepID=A0A250X6H4_9CHLO|nr:hypothetical protein CEUSTIGMA_g6103.t1 [Chlamydomonas eustigma]|eukprot:GAX78665.1 hypothetical protein CEUSTIGMA_g6103.t1 [Chlamydomonas eustigma]